MRKELFDLTNPQKAIWLTEQFYKGQNINNICGTILIDHTIDFKKLQEAINIFIKDNDSFRIHLQIDENGNVKQYFNDFSPYEFKIIELSSNDDLLALETKTVERIFNVIDNDLFEIVIFKFPDNKGGVIVNANHLIADACSAGLIASKIINIYSSLISNSDNPESSTSYTNYINSENEYLASNKCFKDKTYWEDKFEYIPEIATIPSIKPSSSDSCRGKRELFKLESDIVNRISKFCTENKVSIFNFFMAIYAIYISRVSNLQNFILGTPILNRTTAAEKSTPGMFISTVPFSFSIDGTISFIDFTCRIARDTLSMFRHQKYPYQNILEFARRKNPNQANLYDILISYQNTKTNKNSVTIPYDVRWTFNKNVADSMQIHLFDMNDEGALNIAYDYRINKYNKSDIDNIHKRIIFIIEQVLENKNISLESIEIITSSERNLILNKFNDTGLDYDQNKTVVDYFEFQAKKHPNDVALVFHNEPMSYDCLNKKANSLARYLNSIGIGKGSIVGIIVNRSFEMLISILAVLKSGASYIPIDPEFPEDRIKYILAHSNCAGLITLKSLCEKVNTLSFDKELIYCDLDNSTIYSFDDSNVNNKISFDDLSYLIFTSGSTGKPKGVVLTHKNLSNFIASMMNKISYLSDGTAHSIVSITTMSFDIFIFETIVSLCGGLKVFITDESEQKITTKLEHLIIENDIEIIQSTPSIINFHLDNSVLNGFDKLNYFVLAGEQLPKLLVNKIRSLNNKCTIYNGYGPSETTIFSSINDVSTADEITIGQPINNTQIYILNNNLELLPIGGVGEIYISGDGVGVGYINRPDLTVERYLPDPFKPGNVMYKTGDSGFWNNNGFITCKGRLDNQIKLRGLRIELGEIENCINSFKQSANINSCVIIKDVNNTTSLVAFLASNTKINLSDLRKYLGSMLPNYMIPNYFIVLDKLPLTPNGKIDRVSLLNYYIKPDKSTSSNIVSRNSIDTFLVSEIEKLLSRDNLNISDSLFDIGGDSLSAIALCSKISSKFGINISVKDIFDNPIISDLSNLITSKSKDVLVKPISHVEKHDHYIVSSAQKRVYYASKMSGENSTLYNMPGYIIFDKKPDIYKLNNCFLKLIERHPILRSYFDFVDGTLVQKVKEKVDFEIQIFSEPDAKISDTVHKFIKPFDLSNAPLIRAYFIFLGDRFVLLFDMHHIISDGLSLSLLATELSKLYNGEKLDDLEFNYFDYANFEKKNLENNYYDISKNFWINNLKDDVPVLNLPTDKVRPALKSFEGRKVFKKLSQSFTSQIENLAQELNVSNFMLLLSCYYILLTKYSGQEDIIVGTPVAGRNRNEFFNIIGMFVNTLPLRIQLDNNLSFKDFIQNVKNHCLESFDNQMYPYDELINDLDLPHDSSRNQLFDTLFVYQNNGIAPITFDGINANYYIPDSDVSKFDLSLEVIPTNKNKFKLIFEFATKLFKTSTIDRLANHYINILQQVVKNRDILLKDIELASPDEKHKLIKDFNNYTLKYPKEKTLCNLIEEQCEKTPDYTAVVYENNYITYRELNEKANSLARYLQSLGISQGDIIGIMLPRSLEVLVSMLAVWKIGACYIPIDPEFPKSRIKYMLENSNTKLLLCFDNNINFENQLNVSFENMDIYTENNNNLNINISPEAPSYIIYTSGSTGKPKGVMLNHKALMNLTSYLNHYVDYLKHDYENMAIASITTISFDIFIFETLISLQKGLKVVIASKDEQVTSTLLDNLIYRHDIKAIQMTPSRMQIFIDNKSRMPHLSNLKYITLAGEALPDKLLSDILKIGKITVYNGYGPSETTVFSTFTDVTNYKKVNIGRPLPNTQIYILDQNMNICPVGVPGELYISGDGVGLGYINNSSITKDRFLPDPFNENHYFYKTGDLGKYLTNGEISYIGRIDNQIKIRGLRIELDEIEKLILKFPGILKTIVTPKKDASDRTFLIAYLIVNAKIPISNLRSYLSSNLPRYMVPSYFIVLDELPYLPNGKVDKKSLPLPDLSVFENKDNYHSPTTVLEEKIATIFQKILEIPQVSITDNFFDLGGDSLLAMSLQIELLKLSNTVTYSDIFMYPTIKSLASKISKSIRESKSSNNQIDFSNFDSILKKNNTLNRKIKTSDLGNILLTGVTGFLGSHILDTYLQCYPNNKVYCLIRKETGLSIEDKLLEKLHFYFDDKYDSLINKQIIMIKGDITKPNLGINDDIVESIASDITHVINCAANVSHFGNADSFIKTNVKGTQNAVDFCTNYNKKLYHISTTSVSGNGFAAGAYIKQDFQDEIIFKENNFYINQSLDNLYVKSKFDSEAIILSAINSGLDAYILRIGNLMARISDTKFQKNVEQNAYINRLLTFAKLKYIPEYLLDTYAEFTPVDSCAQSIIRVMQHPTKNNRIFHLYDHNHVNASLLLDILNSYTRIEIISHDDFIKRLDKILKSPDSKELLSGIISDLGPDKTLKYNSNIKIDSEFSIKYLDNIGFVWPTITKEYLINFFEKLLKGE